MFEHEIEKLPNYSGSNSRIWKENGPKNKNKNTIDYGKSWMQ